MNSPPRRACLVFSHICAAATCSSTGCQATRCVCLGRLAASSAIVLEWGGTGPGSVRTAGNANRRLPRE